ncbi:MAG: autotransporter beta-domain protein, partial [Frankiales bacterium]|nr:autotransporter beta-domain protein [Frankiales bacterium]
MPRTRTRFFRTAVTGVVAMAGAMLVPMVMTAPANAVAQKITICHATNSQTNPYRRISVSQSAVNAHGSHRGIGAVWSLGIATKWDDVIPDATAGGSNGSKLSWTAAGIDIYNSVTKTAAGVPACKGMTAKQYYDSEIAAGTTQADVLADLNSQKANEDAALLASLGGSFTAANVGQLDSVKATTTAATGVGPTTATLAGSISLGRDGVNAATAERADLSFEWGTDPNLITPATATATPVVANGVVGTPVTTTTSSALTGLTASTTYYFRVVGVTDAGVDTQATLQGDILSFTTTGTTAQTLTFEAGANGTVGDAARTYTFAATASGNPVTIVSADPSVCTVATQTVTLVAAGICSLTASVAGNATYQSVTVTDTFSVAVPTPVAQSLAFEAGADGTVGDAARTYTFAATASGNPVTVVSNDTDVCTVTGYDVALVAAGTCSLTAGVAANASYLAASVTDSFAVAAAAATPVAQSLAFEAGADGTVGDAARTYTFAATASGNPVTVVSNDTNVCTVTGYDVTLVAAGTCSLTASVAANASYLAASVTDSFAVAAAAATPVAQSLAFE